MIRRLAAMATLAIGVRAAETATSPATTSAPDPIAAAKKEYADIKAATTSPEQQSLAVAKNGLELDLRERNERITPPPWMSQKQSAKDAKDKSAKSKNWLLDAMNDKSPPAGTPGKKSLDRREGATGDEQADDELLSNETASPDEKGDSKRGDGDARKTGKNAEAANPLAAYMAGWMTPKDFALLKPGTSGADANATDIPSPAGLSDGLNAVGLAEAAHAETPAANLKLADPGAVFSAPQNPYLTDLSSVLSPAEPAPAIDFANAPTAPLVMEPALLPATPAKAPPDNPAKNDVLRERDDEKYFKQLKRF
ncbi:MAG TPA: hypothetical protein VG710_17960 [Opitutus sp.]|nr:hypothetical protein [Opitutus sp.]